MVDHSNPGRSCVLTYLPPLKGERVSPEISIAIEAAYVPALTRWLQRPELSKQMEVKRYFGDLVSFLWGLDQQQFPWSPPPAFGFAGCGYIKKNDDEFALRFPLKQKTAAEVSMTLAAVLGYGSPLNDMGELATSNRPQLMAIEVFVRAGEWHYGHPAGGHVFPPMRKWLREMSNRAAAEKKIAAAMRTAWKAVAEPDLVEFANECRVRLDGAFSLVCFGDACDVSIYPDLDNEPNWPAPTRFSCHNLDSAAQQITMLCGLAVLHEIAMEALDKS
jgi:hypothetical protein